MSGSSKAGKAGGRALIAFLVFVAIVIAIYVLDPSNLYSWITAFHVIAVISWMAGMVYLPRLFVYHADSDVGSAQSETFKLMEFRLLKIIMNPAMIITWILGLWLAWYSNAFVEIWFVAKFLCVITMSACHGFFAKSVKQFAADENQKSAKQWRLYNEIPTVLMIIIVIMVIVKPL